MHAITVYQVQFGKRADTHVPSVHQFKSYDILSSDEVCGNSVISTTYIVYTYKIMYINLIIYILFVYLFIQLYILFNNKLIKDTTTLSVSRSVA